MSSDSEANSTPPGDFWLQRTSYSASDNAMSSWWTAGEADARCRMSEEQTAAPATDEEEMKNNSRGYKHVPHKDRPPLIVARRNARERRRVQAVNSAFTRLRKVVPIANNRGKRVSKVKTLQTAIDYISGLQAMLKQADMSYHDLDIISGYRYQSTTDFVHVFEDFENEF